MRRTMRARAEALAFGVLLSAGLAVAEPAWAERSGASAREAAALEVGEPLCAEPAVGADARAEAPRPSADAVAGAASCALEAAPEARSAALPSPS